MENVTFQTFGNTTEGNIVTYPALQIVTILLCIWIMVANGFIVICFIVNRRKPWTNYAKQILSLSVDDFILGLATLILLIVLTLNMSKYFILCSFAFYFFCSAQYAGLYHVLAICIYRAMTMLRKPNTCKPVSYKICGLLILSAWITAFSIFTVPLILWAEPDYNVDRCELEFIFSRNAKKAMGLTAAGYLIPLIFTNIIYGCLICKLLSSWKRVVPINETTNNQTSTESTMETQISIRHCLKSQKSALYTIGLLLILLNMCTLPIIWTMFNQRLDIARARYFKVIMALLFGMNSVVNPFVYALRSKFLRIALTDLLREFARLFCAR